MLALRLGGHAQRVVAQLAHWEAVTQFGGNPHAVSMAALTVVLGGNRKQQVALARQHGLGAGQVDRQRQPFRLEQLAIFGVADGLHQDADVRVGAAGIGGQFARQAIAAAHHERGRQVKAQQRYAGAVIARVEDDGVEVSIAHFAAFHHGVEHAALGQFGGQHIGPGFPAFGMARVGGNALLRQPFGIVEPLFALALGQDQVDRAGQRIAAAGVGGEAGVDRQFGFEIPLVIDQAGKRVCVGDPGKA